jgi:uncharacterized protein YkwD
MVVMRRRGPFAALVFALASALPLRAAPTPIRPWWTVDQFAGRPPAEARIFELINNERANAQQAPLRACDELTAAARQHSEEMLEEGYFAHESPHAEWHMPWDRTYRSGFWERNVAENIVSARGLTNISDDDLAARFVRDWMNSAEHKAALLSPKWAETGVGVATKDGVWYATQEFGRRWWATSDLGLTAVDGAWLLTGRAKLLEPGDPIYIGLDDRILNRVRMDVGQSLNLRVRIPADGSRHKFGLHPTKGGNAYYVKWLLYLDASRTLDQALVMPPPD